MNYPEFKITDYEVVLLALEERNFYHDCDWNSPNKIPYTGEIRPIGERLPVAYMINGERMSFTNIHEKKFIPYFKSIEDALKKEGQYLPVSE